VQLGGPPGRGLEHGRVEMAWLAADLGGQSAQHCLERLLVPGLDLPGEHTSYCVSRACPLCCRPCAALSVRNRAGHSNQ